MRKEGVVVFDKAAEMTIRNMEKSGGIGYTAGIFSNDDAHIRYYSERIPMAHVLVNQPTPDAWGPPPTACLPPCPRAAAPGATSLEKSD